MSINKCVLQMETNPVLKNITDFLIEEVSAEEEELAGASAGNSSDLGDGKDATSADVTVETDDKLLKVRGVLVVTVSTFVSDSCDVWNMLNVCVGAGQTAALPASCSLC